MRSEFKVGLLFLITVSMVVVFALTIGAINPFTNAHQLTLLYSFAGGIEVGSPVRVMGVKVGRVKSIEFDSNALQSQPADSEELHLRLLITIDKKAWQTLREDSQFYINLAGVIGEKFIEVTPGLRSSKPLTPGQTLRGIDPPRIDQLISQSYSLAGKIIDFVESNEASVVDTIQMMNRLVANLNETLRFLDKTASSREYRDLVKNLTAVSGDMAYFTQSLRGPEGEKTLKLLNELVSRLEPLDAEAIRKFLQKEGVRAKIF